MVTSRLLSEFLLMVMLLLATPAPTILFQILLLFVHVGADQTTRPPPPMAPISAPLPRFLWLIAAPATTAAEHADHRAGFGVGVGARAFVFVGGATGNAEGGDRARRPESRFASKILNKSSVNRRSLAAICRPQLALISAVSVCPACMPDSNYASPFQSHAATETLAILRLAGPMTSRSWRRPASLLSIR